MRTALKPVPESLTSPDELRRLRLAVEASGEVIFMTDASGTINYVNPEFVRGYGYTPSEVVGRSTPRILKSGGTTPDDYASFWQELLNNRVVRREFLNRTKAGNLIQVESSANPIFTDDELVGFLAVQRDIPRARVLKRLYARARCVIGRSPRRRTIRYSSWNARRASSMRTPSLPSASGRKARTRSGSGCTKSFRTTRPKRCGVSYRQFLPTGERQYSEARFSTPIGDLWLETWLVPMTRGATGPDAVMGVARDITARKALERQFLQAQKMEAVGRLAGGIAHDFNNLLTAIIGYCDLVLENVGGDSELAGDVEEIKKAGERAGRLTRQLLAFSRKQVLVPRVLDLNEVVTELQKMLGRVIGEDISLEIATGRDLEHVRADPGQLEQLIVNLAVNARDAMPKGGTLRIATANAQLDADFASRHDGVVPGR